MKVAFVGLDETDKSVYFDMLRTNLEHGYTQGSGYRETIGVDISVKHLFDNHDQIAKLIIWDVCANSFFRWIRPLFYKGAIGGIVLHSDNSKEGISKTKDIISEFKNHEFPKHLIVLYRSDEDIDHQKNARELERYAAKREFHVHFFEIDESYKQQSDGYRRYSGLWNNLRQFYEEILLDIFTAAVKKIPGNKYDIEEFADQYLQTLKNYDNALDEMYKILESTGLEHDFKNISVRLPEGLFTINLFSSACYYHFPRSDETKYICMVPLQKKFTGWSNVKYLPRNFMLSIAKAYYLLDGDYDDVVKKQLKQL